MQGSQRDREREWAGFFPASQDTGPQGACENGAHVAPGPGRATTGRAPIARHTRSHSPRASGRVLTLLWALLSLEGRQAGLCRPRNPSPPRMASAHPPAPRGHAPHTSVCPSGAPVAQRPASGPPSPDCVLPEHVRIPTPAWEGQPQPRAGGACGRCSVEMRRMSPRSKHDSKGGRKTAS